MVKNGVSMYCLNFISITKVKGGSRSAFIPSRTAKSSDRFCTWGFITLFIPKFFLLAKVVRVPELYNAQLRPNTPFIHSFIHSVPHGRGILWMAAGFRPVGYF